MKQNKYFFRLFLVLVITNCIHTKLFAFEDDVKYKEIITTSRFIDGRIGQNADIQIFLKLENYSSENSEIYSVSGYYLYTKINTPIPIVGIYDGTLTLYVFNNSERGDSLVYFNYELSHFETITYCKGISGFTEKITLDGNSGTWTDGKKSLPVTLNDSDLRVIHQHEYLIITTEDQLNMLDLQEISNPDKNFELINACSNDQQIQILLRFSYPSNPFVNGRCGAGFESGYIALQFDINTYWVTHQRVLFESCYEDVFIESANETEENVYTTVIFNGAGEQKTITLNATDCRIDIK